MSSHSPRKSRLVLDQQSCNSLIRWLLEKNPQTRFRGVEVQHADDHLHVTLHDFALGALVPAFDLAADVHLTLAGSTLQVQVKLHGPWYALQVLLKMLESLGLGIVTYLMPYLRNRESIGLRGATSFDWDLSRESLALPDGKGGSRKVRLTDLVRFDALEVGSRAAEMLIIEFSVV